MFHVVICMNHRHIDTILNDLMTRSKLDEGDWDDHLVLCPTLVNCRQNAATCWPQYPA